MCEFSIFASYVIIVLIECRKFCWGFGLSLVGSTNYRKEV